MSDLQKSEKQIARKVRPERVVPARETPTLAERRSNLAIVVLVTLALIYIMALSYRFLANPNDPLIQSLIANGRLVFGVPAAGVGAFLVLLIWNQTVGGNIRFKFMGFEFYGASAPAILWVVVFLSIVLAIKIL